MLFAGLNTSDFSTFRVKYDFVYFCFQDHSDVFETVGLLSQSVNKLFSVANQVSLYSLCTYDKHGIFIEKKAVS